MSKTFKMFGKSTKFVVSLGLVVSLALGNMPFLGIQNVAIADSVGLIPNGTGYGSSAPVAPNPLSENVRLTGYGSGYDTNKWPTGLSGIEGNAFMSSVYDGKGNIWMIPFNANAVVKLETATGTMTSYSNWPTGSGISLYIGNNAFEGGSLDSNGNIWMHPYNSNSVVKIDTATGAMKAYQLSSLGSKYGGVHAFQGGTYDGNNGIWLAPSSAPGIVKVDTLTGQMTAYSDFPAGVKLSYDTMWAGAVYDDNGTVWMIPCSNDGNTDSQLLSIDIATGAMTTYPEFAGLTSRDCKFVGGIYDGNGNIWIIPNHTNPIVKFNITTKIATNYSTWPDGLNQYHGYFMNGIYDGRYIWLAPYTGTILTRIDTTDGTMKAYPWTGLTGFSPNRFWGGCFDGKSVWLSPFNADRVVRISSAEDLTLTQTAGIAPLYSPVDIKALATSGDKGGYITKMEWLRVDATDQTTYYTNNAGTGSFDTKSTAAIATDKGTADGSTTTTLNYTFDIMAQQNGIYWVKVWYKDSGGNLIKKITSITVSAIKPNPVKLTTNATDDKVYKGQGRPTMTATVDVDPSYTIDSMSYVMVSTTDTDIIATEDEFKTKALEVSNANYTGEMNYVSGTTYNMFNTNNDAPYGILDNCKVWVMAKVKDSKTGVITSVAFESQTFTNIYTPIDLYITGAQDNGKVLYGQKRVGGLDSVYGVPLDLEGTIVLSNPKHGYDTVTVTPEVVEYFTCSQPSPQDVILNDTSFLADISARVGADKIGKIFDFTYSKTDGSWWNVTFNFVDYTGAVYTPSSVNYTTETIEKFAPHDANGGFVDIATTYTPPTDSTATPSLHAIGYIVDWAGGTLDPNDIVLASFPQGFGDFDDYTENTVITIVYAATDFTVTEKYVVLDENGVEISGMGIESVAGVNTGDTFTQVMSAGAQYLTGYVYTGYSVEGTETISYAPLDNMEYPLSKTDYPLYPWVEKSISDNTVITYNYKRDTTNTGYPDDMQKTITINGIGFDSDGTPTNLYSEHITKIVSEKFTPILNDNTIAPFGETDEWGNTVFIDRDGGHWILSEDVTLNSSFDEFDVEDYVKPLTYYYYKDSGPNGTPDFEEANVTVSFVTATTDNDFTTKAPATYTIYKLKNLDPFTLSPYAIDGYAAAGVKVWDKNGTEPEVDYTFPVVGYIKDVDHTNWSMKFVYGKDDDGNGTPDNMEAVIKIQLKETLKNGTVNTIEADELTGRDGQTTTIDPVQYNPDATKFDYVSSLASRGATVTAMYSKDTPVTVTLNYTEKTTPVPPLPPTPTPIIDNGGGGKDKDDTKKDDTKKDDTKKDDTKKDDTKKDDTKKDDTKKDDTKKDDTKKEDTTETDTGDTVVDTTTDSNESAPVKIDGNDTKTYVIVDTPFALVGVAYLNEIPDDKVPQGYVKVKKIDDNGNEYWILEAEETALGSMAPARDSKTNPKTSDSTGSVGRDVIVLFTLMGVTVLVVKRRRLTR